MLTLIKYDFIEISKKILPVWLIIIALMVVQNLTFMNKSAEAISVLVSIFSALLPVAVFFTLIVVGAVWFNNSMYSDRAYLTFTLPRTNMEIILSKVITILVYVILSLIFTLLLVFLTFFIIGDKATFLNSASIMVDFDVVKKAYYLFMANQSVAVFSYMLLIFFSISISSMLTRFRKLAGIGIFIVTKLLTENTLLRAITSLFGLDYSKLRNQSNMMMGFGKVANDFTDILYTQLYVSLLFGLITAVIYIFVIKYITTKRLNL